MTRELATLIKLHRRKIDEMRKELVLLLDARDQCLNHIQNLEKEMLDEQKIAGNSDEGRYIYAGYLNHARTKRARLNKILNETQENIAVLEDGIKDEFTEMKKYEIMKARKEKEAAEEQKKREIEAMDEMTSVKYIRKNQAEGN